MQEITITISDPVRAFVDAEIASGRCASPSEVFSRLVAIEESRVARTAIDEKLLNSLDSGSATPMTAGDWSDIRAEVQRRHALRNGGMK